jgi:hypothetical protein
MKKLYYDIKAFLILRKEVKKHMEQPDWKRLNFRHDWLYRIYTVINPGEKDFGDDEAMLKMKTMEKVETLNKYIASMGLAEIVSLSLEKIPNSNSYLAVYYQIYNWISPWRILSRSVLLVAAVWALIAYWSEIISLF